MCNFKHVQIVQGGTPMERVQRKECDTWKIVDSAHEAGFILTLVVENFILTFLVLHYAILCILGALSRSTFLMCPSFPLTAGQATGALRKGSTARTAFSMFSQQLPFLRCFRFLTLLLFCSLHHPKSGNHLNHRPAFPSTLPAIATT